MLAFFTDYAHINFADVQPLRIIFYLYPYLTNSRRDLDDYILDVLFFADTFHIDLHSMRFFT